MPVYWRLSGLGSVATKGWEGFQASESSHQPRLFVGLTYLVGRARGGIVIELLEIDPRLLHCLRVFPKSILQSGVDVGLIPRGFEGGNIVLVRFGSLTLTRLLQLVERAEVVFSGLLGADSSLLLLEKILLEYGEVFLNSLGGRSL